MDLFKMCLTVLLLEKAADKLKSLKTFLTLYCQCKT